MTNHAKSTILSLFFVVVLLFSSFNKTIGQVISTGQSNVMYKYNKKDAKQKESIIIGKKYDGEISVTTAKRIAEKMETIKAEFVTTGIDTVLYDLKLIQDVNQLKALDLRPNTNLVPSEDPMFKTLLKLLKKYPYLDVMSTGYSHNKETAEKIAPISALHLYENGISKSRIRVNGISSDSIFIAVRISLVPSKEMIDKAVEGKL